ncbi:MAG: hypothetical protein WAP03_08990, partial [Methylorubrum rhodinum]|uniref:hypothetical protein n=1 Tax=Methylorubrum rhodinum TaxID=29428 RepID=UPI003BB04BC6
GAPARSPPAQSRPNDPSGRLSQPVHGSVRLSVAQHAEVALSSISGVVVVPTEKLSREEIERSARAKIQALAASLVAAVGAPPEA